MKLYFVQNINYTPNFADKDYTCFAGVASLRPKIAIEGIHHLTEPLFDGFVGNVVIDIEDIRAAAIANPNTQIAIATAIVVAIAKSNHFG
mmetsp:Transcript_10944/g.9437  ORF Transcript_10944/g.9437 Transcript_10944/m.9437 type:complete len:90 (-) Transcript_10944:1642-1911(-)